MSVVGLDSGCTVKYNPLPAEVPLDFALGNSFRQRVSSRPNTDTVQCNQLHCIALHCTAPHRLDAVYCKVHSVQGWNQVADLTCWPQPITYDVSL